MPENGHRRTLLSAVEGSPAALATGDRAAWLALFAPHGEISDPVGSAPHRSRERRAAFYDTFIAGNTITFHPDHDLVCGNTVWRDLSLTTVLPCGTTLQVPMHLRYDMDAYLRIVHLHAHWEIPAMVRAVGSSLQGLRDCAALTARLLRHLHLGGALGFSRAFRRAPASVIAPLRQMLEGHGWRVVNEKLLISGNFVTASVADGARRGIALAQVSERSLAGVQVYWDNSPAPQVVGS